MICPICVSLRHTIWRVATCRYARGGFDFQEWYVEVRLSGNAAADMVHSLYFEKSLKIVGDE